MTRWHRVSTMVGFLRCAAGVVILRGCCVLEYKGFPAALIAASWCCGLHGERDRGSGGFDAIRREKG